jgi:hypothetical protein
MKLSQRPLPDNTQHSQQTNVYVPVGFEPTISAGEGPRTFVLDRAATGIGYKNILLKQNGSYPHQYQLIHRAYDKITSEELRFLSPGSKCRSMFITHHCQKICCILVPTGPLILSENGGGLSLPIRY